MSKKVKRGRGRPPVFTGNLRRHIVALIKSSGLTGARAALEDEGTSISMPTLGTIAKSAGIELKRGRPAVAA